MWMNVMNMSNHRSCQENTLSQSIACKTRYCWREKMKITCTYIIIRLKPPNLRSSEIIVTSCHQSSQNTFIFTSCHKNSKKHLLSFLVILLVILKFIVASCQRYVITVISCQSEIQCYSTECQWDTESQYFCTSFIYVLWSNDWFSDPFLEWFNIEKPYIKTLG